MIKRAVLALGLLVIVLVVFVVILGVRQLSNRPNNRINRTTFEGIQLGMTQADIEDLLCAVPGNYASTNSLFVKFQTDVPLETLLELAQNVEHPVCVWAGDHGVFIIHLDHEGRVMEKHFQEAVIRDRGLYYWIRHGIMRLTAVQR